MSSIVQSWLSFYFGGLVFDGRMGRTPKKKVGHASKFRVRPENWGMLLKLGRTPKSGRTRKKGAPPKLPD
jgi:hypothetical protein